MRGCIVVSANLPYLPYLNAFLNSVHRSRIADRVSELVVLLVTPDIPPEYCETASRAFGFEVRRIPLCLSDTPLDPALKSAEACKAARYYYLLTVGSSFDVACLMDADLFVVSPNFSNLFTLIAETRLAIGSNERFKWEIDQRWKLDAEPLFLATRRLDKFHCNTPLVLCVQSWHDVIKEYLRIVYRATEDHKEGIKMVGDLFAWNLAVYRCNRENDLVLFPMESMTQVHQTGFQAWTRLQRSRSGFWTTFSGEEVFTIHARPDRPFNVEKFPADQQAFAASYHALVAAEWKHLNMECALRLDDACTVVSAVNERKRP